MISLDKRMALLLYGCCRQAQRSVDFALGAQWDRLQSYYDKAKCASLEYFICKLAVTGWGDNPPPTRHRIIQCSIFSTAFGALRAIAGRIRGNWTLYPAEARFISYAFRAMLIYLRCDEQPRTSQRIELRLDLVAAEMIIENLLFTLPELNAARMVEHFCQSEHVRPFSLQHIDAA